MHGGTAVGSIESNNPTVFQAARPACAARSAACILSPMVRLKVARIDVRVVGVDVDEAAQGTTVATVLEQASAFDPPAGAHAPPRNNHRGRNAALLRF